jgi:hypothetical protein
VSRPRHRVVHHAGEPGVQPAVAVAEVAVDERGEQRVREPDRAARELDDARRRGGVE